MSDLSASFFSSARKTVAKIKDDSVRMEILAPVALKSVVVRSSHLTTRRTSRNRSLYSVRLQMRGPLFEQRFNKYSSCKELPSQSTDIERFRKLRAPFPSFCGVRLVSVRVSLED